MGETVPLPGPRAKRIRLGEDIDKPFVVENGFSVTNNSMGESELAGMTGIKFLFSMNDRSHIIKITSINTLNNKTDFYDETTQTEYVDQNFTFEGGSLFTFMPYDFRINFSESRTSKNPNDQVIFMEITDELDGISKIKTFEGTRITLAEYNPEIIIEEISPNNNDGRITIDLNYSGPNQEINIGDVNIEGNNQWLNNARIMINRSVGIGTDNIKIIFIKNEEEPEDNNFEERISALEEQVNELTERINILEQSHEELTNRTTIFESLVNEINERLNNFIEEIVSYLSFLPERTRRDMICGYMEENDLTNYNSLGLRCSITGRGRVSFCSCR